MELIFSSSGSDRTRVENIYHFLPIFVTFSRSYGILGGNIFLLSGVKANHFETLKFIK